MFPIFTVSYLDDKLLVGGGGGATKAGVNNTLKLFNTEFEISKTFKQDAVMAATFHPFHKIVLAAVGAKVLIYKVGSDFEFLKEIIVPITNEYEFVKKLVFSADGHLLIVLVSDGSWSLYEWPLLRQVHHYLGKIENFDANFVNDSSNILIVTSDGVTIYNYPEKKKMLEITNDNLSYLSEKCDFRGARVINDVLYILLNSKARKASYLLVYIHKKTWKYSTHIRLCRKPMTAYAVNQSQDLMAFGCSDLSLYIYRLDKLTCIKRFPEAHGFPVTCLDFNRDSTVLASGSADGTISLSEIPKGENSLFLGKLYILASIVLAVLALILLNEQNVEDKTYN